ncbi:RlpA-like double-psi beta-barrel-protein domain-containing protein-containing protein [Pterulicium gracile]|uniref:RlpA-like double-psi beta-barrel-protein domain-containing protein-containing protein n=1 Tax=Pterulicium gracile TaxID=1884261 RepID=A0A5C3Q1U8_9AGAR|nr:RlpA-like double-psi beta-barrel-protein domain-containing protein-containing protein [Pterula gracilis]
MKFSTSVIALGAAAAVSGAAVQLAKRFVGDGTWYNVSVGYGACGTLQGDHEYVVAVSDRRYEETKVDGNPNNNKICGRLISIDGESANGPVTARVVDRCGGCKYDDIDMSPALFQHVVGDLGLGRRQINWHFI